MGASVLHHVLHHTVKHSELTWQAAYTRPAMASIEHHLLTKEKTSRSASLLTSHDYAPV